MMKRQNTLSLSGEGVQVVSMNTMNIKYRDHTPTKTPHKQSVDKGKGIVTPSKGSQDLIADNEIQQILSPQSNSDEASQYMQVKTSEKMMVN